MSKRSLWYSIAIAVFSAAIWGIAQIATAHADLPSLFPDSALLYIEARDFRSLLHEWNSSEEKRSWLHGDDYAAFSNSHLFERLAQAQTEFSAAASIPADDALLGSVAGKESALAVYDIGNLQFVYVTRLSQAAVETTPLWQMRARFEQRTEGAAQFYARLDPQSNRTAAFAARDGWLILATREDLVAGVLERLQGAKSHSLPDESWYSDSLKLAPGAAGDLRMVLNLEELVPSPYFRSYWIQRNITEMKQYRAAISDLYRTADTYREVRVLLRKPGENAGVAGDVKPLLGLASDDAVFTSSQASPDPARVLAVLRENLLELKPTGQHASWAGAPSPVQPAEAGSGPSSFEERIDVAPVIAAHADSYQPLQTLLAAAQPSAMLQSYTTRSSKDEMFVAIHRAIILVAPSGWNQEAVQSAISAALRPGLTASQLGVQWAPHASPNGAYASLAGQVPLHIALRGDRLFLADSEVLLNTMLSRTNVAAPSAGAGTTYAAVLQHTPREQQSFRKLVGRLDAAAHRKDATDSDGDSAEPQQPAFFSANIGSLSRMFAHLDRETVDEHDQGGQVTQTVVYHWAHP